jgi:large subunit ribosomal protein L23
MGLLNKIKKTKDEVSEATVNDETAIETGEKSEKVASKKATKNSEDTKNAYKILIKPLVSEKSSFGADQNKYTFIVSEKANKPEVKKAIFAVYGIKPTDVNIIKTKGKKINFKKTVGKRKDLKKAIVTLPKGKTIQLYEGI